MKTTYRRLVVTEPSRLAIETSFLAPLKSNEALARTLFSGISLGTELAYIRGEHPSFKSKRIRAIDSFQQGEGSTTFPIKRLGYMQVGVVERSRCPKLREGSLICYSTGHADLSVVSETQGWTQLNETVDPLLGIYQHQMGPVCLNALLYAVGDYPAEHKIPSLGQGVQGKRVLVTGGGVVGLLLALLCKRLGSRDVCVATSDPFRQKAAAALGLTVTALGMELGEFCKDRWANGKGSVGADLVFQTHPSGSALNQSLRSLRVGGTVVSLALYNQGLDELSLDQEFHMNGLVIKSAQIGRRPPGLEEVWPHDRLAYASTRLLSDMWEDIRGVLFTDLVPFSSSPGFFSDVLTGKRRPIQAVFHFDKTET